MIWRRTSADSDGSLNGDQKFGFPQNRVPGVEANPTTISRSFHEPYLLLPLTTHLRLLYRLFSRPQARLTSHNGIYSALPRERMANSPFLRYSTHNRNMSVPHPWSILAPHNFWVFRLLFHNRRFTRFLRFIPSTFTHTLHL